MNVQEIYIGGWFQRTVLHLQELFLFFEEGKSELKKLDAKKLKKLHQAIGVENLSFVMDELDYISFTNSDGVSVRIYEDGLTTLGLDNCSDDIEHDIQLLTNFYENKLSPAFSYVFSLGAPVPKELAQIKTIYPYFIILDNELDETVQGILDTFSEKKHITIDQNSFSLIQGELVHIFNNKTSDLRKVRNFIEETIFLREFQSQLKRYLDLHRTIWEQIADVKERGEIKGSEVKAEKTKAESYAKTINLIDTRISQMDTYIHTREHIAKDHNEDPDYNDVLKYRYETLSNTLAYVTDLWTMTSNYVERALEVFDSIQSKATEKSIKGLTLITTIGVLAGLARLFFTDVTKINIGGVTYFFGLLIVGYILGIVVNKLAQNRTYKIKNIETAKDI